VLTLCVGRSTALAEARALLAERGHALVEAAGPTEVVEALARGPTPDLVIAAGADAQSIAALVRAVRSHVRGEAAGLLALVPAGVESAALEAGADLALPVPLSAPILSAAIASLERHSTSPGTRTEGAQSDHDLFFLRNPHPMWFYDLDTFQFVAVNDAAVQQYGYTREEFLAMTIRDIRPEEDVDRLMRVTAHVPPGLARTSGWRHRAKDGRILHVEIISYPVRFAGRACKLVLAHDVSERVEAERKLEELRAQLAVSDRMASIGTLAAGVAHEINNPLTWILANLAFAADELPALHSAGDPRARAIQEALAEAATGARRVRTIINDLRSYSRSDDEEVGPVAILRVVDAALHLASNEVSHRAHVVVDVAEAPPVLGNEARLGQVLLNLIVNAAHAVPEGNAAAQEIIVRAVREGDHVALTVSDTGGGVDPAVADRIFEPFFTTKAAGEGTGLGLWVCRRIVVSLGGSIELLPPSGRGATFRILLPIALQPAAPAADAAAKGPRPGEPAGRRAHVLVVDDEPLVGRALLRALAPVADVEVETSSRAAVERLERGERFDLILSDVMMPELPGADFNDALERLDPSLARSVVYMTGGAFSARAQEFLERTPNLCLEKPVDVDRLRGLVLAALTPPAAAPPA